MSPAPIDRRKVNALADAICRLLEHQRRNLELQETIRIERLKSRMQKQSVGISQQEPAA